MSSANLAGTTSQPSWAGVARAARRAGWLGAGLASLALGGLEVVNHGPWALAGLITSAIAPDLTFLKGMGQASQMEPGQLPAVAVPWYNAAHRPWVPALLLVTCVVIPLSWAPLFAAGLGWLAHIALDRAMGFGLRTADGFQRDGHGHR